MAANITTRTERTTLADSDIIYGVTGGTTDFKSQLSNLKNYVHESSFTPAIPDGEVDGVGTNPNTYATLADALAAGKYSPVITASTTETADITLTQYTVLYIKDNARINMGEFQIIMNGQLLHIVGEGPLTSGGITFAYTTPGTKSVFSGGSYITGRDFLVWNQSTTANSTIGDGNVVFNCSKVTFILPDVSNCGVDLGDYSEIDMTIAGAGSNATSLLKTGVGSVIPRLSFSSNLPITTILDVESGAKVENISVSSAYTFSINNAGTIRDCSDIGGSTITCTTTANNAIYDNVDVGTSGTIYGNGYVSGKVIFCKGGALDTTSVGSPTEWDISNSYFSSNVSIGGDYTSINSVTCDGFFSLYADFCSSSNIRLLSNPVDNGNNNTFQNISRTDLGKIYYRTNMNIVSTSAASYVASYGDFVKADSSINNQTIDLPSAQIFKGDKLTVKKMDAANTVTLTPSGLETIDGNSTHDLFSIYEMITIISDGSNWLIV